MWVMELLTRVTYIRLLSEEPLDIAPYNGGKFSSWALFGPSSANQICRVEFQLRNMKSTIPYDYMHKSSSYINGNMG
jgi:hypothetical protein